MNSYYAGDSNYAGGDYYQGDDNYAAGGLSFKGLGRSLSKLAKGTVGKVAKGVFAATPLGMAVNTALPIFTRSGKPQGGSVPRPTVLPVVPEPGLAGFGHRLVPGGQTGYQVQLPYRRHRRVNPLNVKALRRAGRRVKGFLRIARRLGALPVNRGKGKKLYAFHRAAKKR